MSAEPGKTVWHLESHGRGDAPVLWSRMMSQDVMVPNLLKMISRSSSVVTCQNFNRKVSTRPSSILAGSSDAQ